MYTRILFMLAITHASNSYGHLYSHDDHGHNLYHGPIAIPHVLKNGHIADTHEVAVAKAEHLAVVSKAKSFGGFEYGDHGYTGSQEYGHGHKYSYDNHGLLLYYGPTATPHVLKNGHIADTHEVAVAKAEHLAVVSKAKSYGGYENGDHGYTGSQEYGHGHKYSYDNHGHLLYHGPTAIPHVLKNGHIADTHEVAVAKAEHLAAVSKAKDHYYTDGYSEDYAGGYTRGYHELIAKPVVLQLGYLADTHEVATDKEHHLQALHTESHNTQYDYHY